MTPMDLTHLADEPGTVQAARDRSEGWWGRRALADGLEAGATHRPDAVAVADATESLTYRAAAGRVAQTITALRDRGVDAGSRVVLVAGNTVAGWAAYHAGVRLGAVMVVLDRRVGDADRHHAHDLLGPGAVEIVAPTLAVTALDPSADPPWSEPDRTAPRVILFTSGTTGRPKAVVHSLDSLTAGADNMARITGADEQAVYYLVSPLTSIAGLTQVHLCADRHATLVLDDDFDAERALDRINAVGATHLGGAPVIAERLLRAAAARPDRRCALRNVALGGAMLPRPLLEQAAGEFGLEVARVYGSSEMACATGSVPTDDRDARLADDGLLMPGTEVRVGSAEHPQEGLLRGPARCLGYADPADHAAAFVDGWYRTGDLVEVTDGRLTVVGRLKDVVVRNGLKISLPQVEDALTGLPGAEEVAAFAVADPETGERLAVAVWPRPGAVVPLAAVVAHCSAAGLAVRWLPEQVVIWDGPLPRTTSGKVVRSRLVMDAPGLPTELAERCDP